MRRVRGALPAVKDHLDALEVPYRLAPGLVRGLDYYTRTAFEYYVVGREGQQQAIGGGGRYDGLVELLGGRPTPGIGFGIGLDRLILALADAGVVADPEPHPVAVVVGRRPGRHAGPADRRHATACGGDRGPGRPRPAQARQAARVGRRATRPTSRSSSATSWRAARSGCATCRPGRRSSWPLDDLVRTIERGHGSHRHGSGTD